eukprot:3683526-Pyramimonas_sp.AAC.1
MCIRDSHQPALPRRQWRASRPSLRRQPSRRGSRYRGSAGNSATSSMLSPTSRRKRPGSLSLGAAGWG